MVGRRRVLLALALALGLGPAVAPAAPALPPPPRPDQVGCPPPWLGTTTNVAPRISDDGRFALFTAYAPGSGGAGGVTLLRDLHRNETTAISGRFPAGWENTTFQSDISGDGNRISYLRQGPFESANNAPMWVYDRRTGARTQAGPGFIASRPDLSATGRYLAFAREGAAPEYRRDIYVRDVDRNATTLVSADRNGGPANRNSADPQISADGRFVLFSSNATDLTPDPVVAGGPAALFVRDLKTGRTTAVPDRGGRIGVSYVFDHQLSPDGRFVVYSDFEGVRRYDRRTGSTVAASKPRSPAYYATAAAVGTGGKSVLLRQDPGLVVRDVATGREVGVPPAGQEIFPGAMTPDARYVIFSTASVGSAPNEIRVRDLVGHTVSLVSTPHAGGECEVSP